MDDQTRGKTPGTGPDFDAPLKRDRKRLRSSEPTIAPTPLVQPYVPTAGQPVDLREQELTPVEQLFVGEESATPASVPEVRQRYDVDLTEKPSADRHDDEVAKRRTGLNFLRKSKDDASTEAADQPAARGSDAVGNGATRREPYVPPGGFSAPGHPRLGPLAPEPMERHAGLARLDVAAIVTAVIVPPIGLIIAVIALIRGKQVRGWASDLARAAISVSVVMSVVLGGVGAYVWATETEKAEQLAVIKAEQRAHDRVAAASAPFCDVLAANPTIYSTADPDYGWPALDAPGGYNAAIAQYAAAWAQIAEVAPEGIAAETTAISERVAGVVSIANALGAQNRAGDLLGLHAEDDLATVESWYVEYCNPPEIPAE